MHVLVVVGYAVINSDVKLVKVVEPSNLGSESFKVCRKDAETILGFKYGHGA